MVVGRYKPKAIEFMAAAGSPEELNKLLRKAWHKHCQETGACLAYYSFSDVQWEEVVPGTVYRDQAVFYREEN